MTRPLEGKVAVLIGGANGIGRACVNVFAANGAHVVFGDIDATSGQSAANELGREDIGVSFVSCDAVKGGGVRALVSDATALHGVPDFALYAACVIRPMNSLKLTEADYDAGMRINLELAVLFFQAVAAALNAANKPSSRTSKTASHAAWLAHPGKHNYFCGPLHVARVQAAGVPTGPVLYPSEPVFDAYLQARGFWQPCNRPYFGRHLQASLLLQLDYAYPVVRRPAPLFGEHSQEILLCEPGLTAADLRALEPSGIVGRRPLPSRVIPAGTPGQAAATQTH